MANRQALAWLQVSMTVDGEMAEAVAEVLARFAPNGVAIESTQVEFPPHSDFDQDAIGVINGPLKVYGFLPLDLALTPDHNEEAILRSSYVQNQLRAVEEALWHLGFIRPLPIPQYKIVYETDWSAAWKEHYHPIPIGKRLLIVPAWLDVPPEDRIPIKIDPGMAFGTGTHPTTQLCLTLLEEFLQDDPDLHQRHCIDIGCGSGILAIAALKLGIGRALGVDTDANVIPIAQDNAALNRVADNLTLSVGSLQDILNHKTEHLPADIALANILAPVIIRLLDEGMGSLLTENGVLILSGILKDQLEDPQIGLYDALTRNNLQCTEVRLMEDWAAMVVKRVV